MQVNHKEPSKLASAASACGFEVLAARPEGVLVKVGRDLAAVVNRISYEFDDRARAWLWTAHYA